MTWEALLKQLHKEKTAGKETKDPAGTSKGSSTNEKWSPCTSAKRKWSKKEEKAPSSNKKIASVLVEEKSLHK